MWWAVGVTVYVAVFVMFFVFWVGCHRDDEEDEYEEFTNVREPGEFGDGVTVRRKP